MNRGIRQGDVIYAQHLLALGSGSTPGQTVLHQPFHGRSPSTVAANPQLAAG